jgi:hypothetical protein
MVAASDSAMPQVFAWRLPAAEFESADRRRAEWAMVKAIASRPRAAAQLQAARFEFAARLLAAWAMAKEAASVRLVQPSAEADREPKAQLRPEAIV